MTQLDISKSLEKYISLRAEVNMIYDALTNASSDLDHAIQLAIDIARGK